MISRRRVRIGLTVGDDRAAPDRYSEVRLGEQWIRWKSPTCAANNVLVPGSTWLDYDGKSVVEDAAHGVVCEMNFETATWKNAYKVPSCTRMSHASWYVA